MANRRPLNACYFALATVMLKLMYFVSCTSCVAHDANSWRLSLITGSIAERNALSRNDLVNFLKIRKRLVAGLAVEIIRQRLSSDTQSLNLELAKGKVAKA